MLDLRDVFWCAPGPEADIEIIRRAWSITWDPQLVKQVRDRLQ